MKSIKLAFISAVILLSLFNCSMTLNRKVRIIVPDSKQREVFRAVTAILKSNLREDSEFAKQALEVSGLSFKRLTETLTLYPRMSTYVAIAGTKESEKSVDCVISVTLGGNDPKIRELSQFAANYMFILFKEEFPEYEVKNTF